MADRREEAGDDVNAPPSAAPAAIGVPAGRSRRILVTGGAGYVGSALARLLVEQGHSVRCLDVRAPVPNGGTHDMDAIAGDVRDGAAVARALEGVDGVVHLAAIVGYPACDAAPDNAWSINVEGTRTVAEAIAPGTPFVAFSTCSIYGKSPTRSCSEQDAVAPLTLYSKSKLAAEAFVRRAGGVVLRPATVFGPSARFRGDLIVHDFIRRGLAREHLMLFQPQAMRAFVHIEDICRAALFGLENHEAMSGNVYNIGHQASTVTKAELARMIAAETDLTFAVENDKEDPDARDYWVNTDRISALGFAPTRGLPAGIRETTAWMRERLAGAAVA